MAEHGCGICGTQRDDCVHNRDNLSKELDKIYSRTLRKQDDGDCPNCGRSYCNCKPIKENKQPLVSFDLSNPTVTLHVSNAKWHNNNNKEKENKIMSNTGEKGVDGISNSVIQCNSCRQKQVCKYADIYEVFINHYNIFTSSQTSAFKFIKTTHKCEYYSAESISTIR